VGELLDPSGNGEGRLVGASQYNLWGKMGTGVSKEKN